MLKLAGPDKIKNVNNSKEAVHSTLKKIEDVLGDVPAVEELRSAVKKLMVSVDSVLS